MNRRAFCGYWVVGSLYLSVGAGWAWADEEADLEKQAASLDEMAQKEGKREVVLGKISQRTGVTVETLNKQSAETGLSPGGLLVANSLAKASGKSFEEIAAAKKSGQGWGRIAKDNGVKLGPVLKSAKATAKEATQAKPSDTSQGEAKRAQTDTGKAETSTGGGKGKSTTKSSGGGKGKK